MAHSKPLIGIFWLISRRVVAFTQPAETVQAAAGVKDADLGHAEVWDEVVKLHPKLRGKEYWSVERGRIIYRLAENRYVIFTSSKVAKSASHLQRIIRRFRLSSEQIKVATDLHYDPMKNYLDDE